MTGRSNGFEARHGHVADDQRAPRRLAMLAGVLLIVGSSQALAQVDPPPPPDPTAGAVWGGCVLSEAAVNALPEGVDYVVVYSRRNPNDGQPVAGGHTGPVICINPDRVGITAYDRYLALLTPETNIPGDTDPGDPAATTVELLAAEEALVLQYQPHGGPEADREKRFCQTVGGLTDCFRIFPTD